MSSMKLGIDVQHLYTTDKSLFGEIFFSMPFLKNTDPLVYWISDTDCIFLNQTRVLNYYHPDCDLPIIPL